MSKTIFGRIYIHYTRVHITVVRKTDLDDSMKSENNKPCQAFC